MTVITVHYLENSRAHRVLWLLEELDLDYEVKLYRRGADMRAPGDLKKIHPLGKSPIIEDDGLIVAESGTITEYLVQRYGGGELAPAEGGENWLRYKYWLHYAEGSAMPLLVMKIIFAKLPGQLPAVIRPVGRMISSGASSKLINPQMRDHIALWNGELSKHGWFAGPEFTAADIMMSFPVEAGVDRFEYDGDVRAIRTYLEAIRARPAYARALEKGGAYAYSKSTV